MYQLVLTRGCSSLTPLLIYVWKIVRYIAASWNNIQTPDTCILKHINNIVQYLEILLCCCLSHSLWQLSVDRVYHVAFFSFLLLFFQMFVSFLFFFLFPKISWPNVRCTLVDRDIFLKKSVLIIVFWEWTKIKHIVHRFARTFCFIEGRQNGTANLAPGNLGYVCKLSKMLVLLNKEVSLHMTCYNRSNR